MKLRERLMARPKIHATIADRQAAYRARQTDRMADWHHELGEAWREVQTLLFRAGMPETERAPIERALARIEAVREQMRS
jgi:hypothetical protein